MSNINEDDLYASFSPFGSIISCKVIRDKYTGSSRGFAFIDMEEEEGQKAISGMDRQEINGRPVNVSVARERAPRPSDRRY
ncbi:RNA-binding protein [Chitinophaga sp. B61]|uniref:RNA-binding protein n=2 Tax=Chitinophaga rhizophila TaxID=2866212 RepID=A0ABS7GL04_9BACT|nr:RNA-binding protein [Chitinophaga rhizophila]